ncbi:MAG: hypothetical protein WC703_10875 [Candidatus Neomarinimicrobiota bacterium]
MAKNFPLKPAILIAQMQTMLAALTKYTASYTPVSPTIADFEASATELSSALQNQAQTAGAAEKATKDLYAARDRSIDLLRRMRDAVYAHFGKSDPRIVEYGLDTLKARRATKNGNDSTTPPQER